MLWVHSSELPDPTPFLDAGQLLLTDGAQFPTGSQDRERYDCYVAGLSARGIVGIGFGTQLIHGHLPPELESACDATGFLITDLTPFLAIVRYVAGELAREQNERIRWSLDAQRAIARAALRPDGLTSILAELANQLQCSDPAVRRGGRAHTVSDRSTDHGAGHRDSRCRAHSAGARRALFVACRPRRPGIHGPDHRPR